MGCYHAQSKEKQTFISKNKATLMIIGPHCFYRQKYEKTHFAPEYTRGPRHMAFLRRPLSRPHHYLAPLLHPLVPFYRPIMHFLKLIPLNRPELCITVNY